MTDTLVYKAVSPLEAIVNKLEDQKKAQYDMVLPGGHVRYNAGTGLLEVMKAEIEEYAITDLCHLQIGDKLEIPRSYYKKMLSSAPELLGQNINGWLSRKEKTKFLLRSFKYPDTNNLCRAMLSDRYCIMDNYDVLLAALEAIKQTGIAVEIVKAEITDSRMYLHVVAPEIHVQATELLDGYLANTEAAILNKGIISGMVITNSEVGMGTFEVSARAQILRCKNGMHDRSAKFRKVHLGGRLEEGTVTWSQNTKNKNFDLIIAQTKDAVKTYLSEDYLGQLTTKLTKSKEVQIENPIQVIENVSLSVGMGEEHKNSILRYFLGDGDNSAFGVLNAFTRESQKLDADNQYRVESEVFELLPDIHKFDKPNSKN